MIQRYFVAAAVAVAAFALHYLPFPPFLVTGEFGVRRPVSPAILAILLGTLVRNLFPISTEVQTQIWAPMIT